MGILPRKNILDGTYINFLMYVPLPNIGNTLDSKLNDNFQTFKFLS
jgi:hypothetical protein